MEAYEIWLLLHIAAAILWVGGGTVLGMLQGRLEKAQAGPALAAMGAQMEFFSKALFMPAALVAVIAGVAMVLSSNGEHKFEEPWVAIGIAGYLITLIVGMAVLGPTSRRLSALVADKGPADPEVAGLRARMKRFSGVNELVLWLVVLDMVFKPGA